jgi:hypothetical protein
MPEGLPLSHRSRRNRLVLVLTNNEFGAKKIVNLTGAEKVRNVGKIYAVNIRT